VNNLLNNWFIHTDHKLGYACIVGDVYNSISNIEDGTQIVTGSIVSLCEVDNVVHTVDAVYNLATRRLIDA
jgi:hypothetical protein